MCNDFCNLRLYSIECNSPFYTKQSLQRFKNEALAKYPDCGFDTGRSWRHDENFNPDSTVICGRCIQKNLIRRLRLNF